MNFVELFSEDDDLSESSCRVYSIAYRRWVDWTRRQDRAPIPAEGELIAAHIRWMSNNGYSFSSISQSICAIKRAHLIKDLSDPIDRVVDREVKKIQKWSKGHGQKKETLLADDIHAMLDALDTSSARDIRDRALIALGYAGGFRRSELVALDVASLSSSSTPLTVRMQSRPDKLVKIWRGASKYCPVRLLACWRDVAGIEDGALFRRVDRWCNVYADRLSPRSVHAAVRRAAKLAGLDAKKIGSDSLRAGRMIRSKARRGSLKDKQGIIYVVNAVGTRFFKVGYTSMKMEARLNTLQIGNHLELDVVATIKGTMDDEQRLHDRISQYHHRGEWFELPKGFDIESLKDMVRQPVLFDESA